MTTFTTTTIQPGRPAPDAGSTIRIPAPVRPDGEPRGDEPTQDATAQPQKGRRA
jgi:hypothetical protein